MQHHALTRMARSAPGLLFALTLCATRWLAADDAARWPNFRGPRLDGSSPAHDLPVEWSTEEGVLWSTPLPGPGASTPAVWDGRLFLTSADAASGELLALAIDGATGAIRWRRVHGHNRRQGRNDMTAPSPVTDGRRVVFLFGTGTMVAYDLEGRLLWEIDLRERFGTLSWLFGYGASPLLHDGRLYLQLMRRPTHREAPEGRLLESFLVAFDPATGDELWRQPRPAEAVGESWESYITPTIHRQDGLASVVLAGADALTAHAVDTGAELWRRHFNDRRLRNWRLVPTPVSDGRLVITALPRGVSLAAVDPSRDAVQLTDGAVWSLSANAPDVCSPTLYDGSLYVLDGDRRVVTSLDPATGRQRWRGELGGNTVIRSSPTAGDGKLYFIDEDGVVFVLATGDTFEVLSRIPMGGDQPARSSVVLTDGRLYVRTGAALYCIGQTAPRPGGEP